MREEDFSKKEFNHKILLKATKKEAFNFISTGKGLIAWFLGKVEYSVDNKQLDSIEIPPSGTRYLWKWKKEFELEGTILNSENNRYMEFTFGAEFIVRFILEEYGSNTILHLNQKNLNPTKGNEFSFINCCVCWVFFLTNLKSVIENGIDLRETAVINETFINQ